MKRLIIYVLILSVPAFSKLRFRAVYTPQHLQGEYEGFENTQAGLHFYLQIDDSGNADLHYIRRNDSIPQKYSFKIDSVFWQYDQLPIYYCSIPENNSDTTISISFLSLSELNATMSFKLTEADNPTWPFEIGFPYQCNISFRDKELLDSMRNRMNRAIKKRTFWKRTFDKLGKELILQKTKHVQY